MHIQYDPRILVVHIDTCTCSTHEKGVLSMRASMPISSMRKYGEIIEDHNYGKVVWLLGHCIRRTNMMARLGSANY